MTTSRSWDIFEVQVKVTTLSTVGLPKTEGQFSIYQHGKPF